MPGVGDPRTRETAPVGANEGRGGLQESEALAAGERATATEGAEDDEAGKGVGSRPGVTRQRLPRPSQRHRWFSTGAERSADAGRLLVSSFPSAAAAGQRGGARQRGGAPREARGSAGQRASCWYPRCLGNPSLFLERRERAREGGFETAGPAQATSPHRARPAAPELGPHIPGNGLSPHAFCGPPTPQAQHSASSGLTRAARGWASPRRTANTPGRTTPGSLVFGCPVLTLVREPCRYTL